MPAARAGRLAASLAAAALLAAAADAQCDLGGTWQSVGSDDTVTVRMTSPTTFVASAASGWKNASGTVTAAGALSLDCCKAGGIVGTINAACSRIAWDDGVGSRWVQPRAQNVTVSNVVPRHDDTGALLHASDGCLLYYDFVYYLVGARYQCCPVDEQAACYQPCGWRNTTFGLYSSDTLEDGSWHLESDNLLPVISDPTSPHSNLHNAYFEPCIMYSPTEQHFALWFLPEFTKAVAVSDYIAGPYETVSWDVGLPQGSDTYFWQLPNGTTFVKHNGPPPPGVETGAHYVSRLADDLLSVLPNSTSDALLVPSTPVPPFYMGKWPSCTEGGGIYFANGTWTVMAGSCCCFCFNGSNAYVWSSPGSPLGPYTRQDDVGVVAWNASRGQYATRSQMFSFASLATTTGPLVLSIGQQFGSAPDGLKCHDLQAWLPVTQNSDGSVAPLLWADEFTVELAVVPR